MAKRIKIDFSKVEERSGWNTRQIPEGIYEAKVESVQNTEAQDGTGMLVYALVPNNPAYKTRRFPYYCKLQQNQLWKLRDLLVAAGQSVPKKALQIDPEKVIGKLVAIEVEDDTYNGTVRSQVQGIYSTDILEDDDSEPEEDVDDDEELDEEEELEESEDDEEEFDDEDEDDDLEDIDLDDEDDEEDEEEFDDEEEEVDDDEEEEPEPEPTPRKRPGRTPAKTAPRKSVKRRA